MLLEVSNYKDQAFDLRIKYMQDDSNVYLQFNFAEHKPSPNSPLTASEFTWYVLENYGTLT